MILSRLTIFTSLLTFVSLNCICQTNVNNDIGFFDPGNFQNDTLYIKSRFIECGEWGGHIELSKVYAQAEDFYIDYEKFSADCNTIKANNGEPGQILFSKQTKKLLEKDKRMIVKYFHQLVDAKLREANPFHFGYTFEIKNTDKSINLFVYTLRGQVKEEYTNLINQLFE